MSHVQRNAAKWVCITRIGHDWAREDSPCFITATTGERSQIVTVHVFCRSCGRDGYTYQGKRQLILDY